jgi:branched-chain amino acid aminotransferase
MPECTRKHFISNGILLPVNRFEACFSPRSKYIYEVFRVIDGIPLFIEDHIERFCQTIRLAGVDLDFDRYQLFSDIEKTIEANDKSGGNIKISVAPDISGEQQQLIYYTSHQYPTNEQFAHGVRLKLLDAERQNPNAKVMDISLRAETDQLKLSDDVYEILLVDHDGFITEGSRSNVFFIRGSEVITPPVEVVLPGITRKKIIRLCQEHEIKILEHPVHQNSLAEYDSLFISGTSRKVLPVNQVDNLTYSVDNLLMRKISELFNQLTQEYLDQHRK